MTAQKIPPLPPEVRARLKPFRHTRERQDEIFTDTGGQKATKIRRDREDVVEAEVADPVMTRQRRVNGETKIEPVLNKAHRVQSRLERMHKRGEIEELEYKAGERFALDVEMSAGSVKSCLNNEIGGGDPEMAMIYNSPHMAAIRVTSALEAMGSAVWPLVVWVAVEGRPASEWAEVHGYGTKSGIGVAMLRLGLGALVKHYRMEAE